MLGKQGKFVMFLQQYCRRLRSFMPELLAGLQKIFILKAPPAEI